MPEIFGNWSRLIFSADRLIEYLSNKVHVQETAGQTWLTIQKISLPNSHRGTIPQLRRPPLLRPQPTHTLSELTLVLASGSHGLIHQFSVCWSMAHIQWICLHSMNHKQVDCKWYDASSKKNLWGNLIAFLKYYK